MTSIPLTGVTTTARAGSLLVWTVTPPSPVPSGGWSVVAAGSSGGWSPIVVPSTYFLVVSGDEGQSFEVLAPEGGETSTQFMVYSAGDNWTPIAT